MSIGFQAGVLPLLVSCHTTVLRAVDSFEMRSLRDGISLCNKSVGDVKTFDSVSYRTEEHFDHNGHQTLCLGE